MYGPASVRQGKGSQYCRSVIGKYAELRLRDCVIISQYLPGKLRIGLDDIDIRLRDQAAREGVQTIRIKVDRRLDRRDLLRDAGQGGID